MHQTTKLVKVSSLPDAERKPRGLADAPDDMEVSIVTGEITTDPVAVPEKPLELKKGQRHKPLPLPAEAPAEPKGERKRGE